jgi:mRNA interferase RelE/StbE
VAALNVQFKPAVEKDLRRIPQKLTARILKRIEQLSTAPFPATAIKLEGAENFYRVRVGDFRIIYEIDAAANILLIHYVRNRKGVYRKI